MISALPLTAIPAEDEALRPMVKRFLHEKLQGVGADVRARSWMGFDAAFSRAMAEQGWLGLTFPQRFGGAGRSPFARFVLVEELLAAGAPVSAHWIADRQSGPLILKYGTEAQKQFYLPRICRGEAFYCIGMSEPGSGSDLASVKTRATKTDKGWLLSGSKIWTTNAYRSHYMIALVRSSGKTEDRQKGLSQFIIDLSLPGITIRPIKDLAGDSHFSEVFFDDVALSDDALIGEEGGGWEQVTAELAFERSGPERIYSSMVLLDEWLAYLKAKPKHDLASIRLAGKLLGELAVLRAMSVSLTGLLNAGASPVVEAALVKDQGTEFEQALPHLIADALGADEDAPAPEILYKTLAYVTQVCPSFSLRGGTREILRGMIARGLGMR
ncbi:MAG: acyl-CoA dehydrogenase family protein [Rhodospirillales bacterium]|nr:acyl-CoA dehydrogenase family protein [Rhodospirillales bacterium]